MTRVIFTKNITLYFGVTPALLLFWPYVILTGHYLWHKEAVMIFCAGGFLASAGIFLAVRRRYFTELGPGRLIAGILALGLGHRRPGDDAAPGRMGGAHQLQVLCLVMASPFAALWCSLHSARRRRCWLALAKRGLWRRGGSAPLAAVRRHLHVGARCARSGSAEGGVVWRQSTWWRLWAAAPRSAGVRPRGGARIL